MLKNITVGLMVSVLGLALEAQAGSISYTNTIASATTDWSKPVSLHQFDSSLGTLDSIDITLNSGMSTTLYITNNAASASSGTAYTEFHLSLDTSSIGNYNLFGKSPANPVLSYSSPGFDYNLASGQGTSSPLQSGSGIVDSGLLTDPSLLSYFIGSGFVGLGASTLTQTLLANTGGGTLADQNTTAGLVSTITYNYTVAPVPEPSTMGILGLGLAGLGMIWRFRSVRKRS